jgi:hypothetical protein
MDHDGRIQDWDAGAIRGLRLEGGRGLDDQHAAALKEFIQDIGQREEALAAVAMPDRLEPAA